MSSRIQILKASASDFALEVLSSVPTGNAVGDHTNGRIVKYGTHIYVWCDHTGAWYKFNNAADFTSLETRLSSQEADRLTANTSLETIDVSLEARVSSEESEMLSAVSSIETSAKIQESSLETRLLNEEVNRSTAVDAEESRALVAEGSIESRTSTEEDDREAAVDSLEARALGVEDSLELRLSNEESAEVLAETSLNTRILTEESARLAEDGSVATAIATAATARGVADTSLETRLSNEENRVDAILNASTADKDSFAEVVSFINAVDVAHDAQTSTEISSIDSSIASAETARSVSDNSLEIRLSSEEDAEAAAELSLNTRMAAEESNELSAEVSLEDTVSSEESIRLAEDNSLSARALVNENSRVADDASLEARLSLEEVTMASDDSSLEVLLSSAISGRQAVGNSVEVRLSEEESTMLSEISSEESARTASDASLEVRISSEEDSRTVADNSLTVRIIAEETNRNVADSSLETRLLNEESTESSAKLSLQTRISSEEDAMSAGDTSVQANISTQVSSERSRIDTILDNASADKDTFAEIVSFITAVDTESDDTLASYVTTIDSSISSEQSAMSASDSSLEMELSSQVSARQSLISSLEVNHSGEISSLASANDSLELREEARHVRIDFTNKSSFTVLSTDLPSGFAPSNGMVQVFQEVSSNVFRHLVSPMNYDPTTGEMNFDLGSTAKTGFAIFYSHAGGNTLTSSSSSPGGGSSSQSSYAEHRITDATLNLGAGIGDTTSVVLDVSGVTASNVDNYLNYDALYIANSSFGTQNTGSSTISRTWNSDYSQFTISWTNTQVPSAFASGYWFQFLWGGANSEQSFIGITLYFDVATEELNQATGGLGEYIANNPGGFPLNPPYLSGTGTATYNSSRNWAFWGQGPKRKYNKGPEWVFDLEDYPGLSSNLRNYIYLTGGGHSNNGDNLFQSGAMACQFTRNGIDYYVAPSVSNSNPIYSEITSGRTAAQLNRVTAVVGGDLSIGWWNRSSSSDTNPLVPTSNTTVTFYILNNSLSNKLLTDTATSSNNYSNWAGDTSYATDIKIVIDTTDQSYDIYRNSNVGGTPTWVAVDRAYLSNQEVN